MHCPAPFRIALALACTVAALFTMWTAWRDMYVASSGERLLRIGLMIAFAILTAGCFKRARGR